jgi:hypothetical protein
VSAAFKCDRCKQLAEGDPAVTLTLDSGLRVQLCRTDCEAFYSWVDRKPAQEPTPISFADAHDAYMERMREQNTAHPTDFNKRQLTDCGRCWQHGFNRTHGPMEVCPYRGTTG